MYVCCSVLDAPSLITRGETFCQVVALKRAGFGGGGRGRGDGSGGSEKSRFGGEDICVEEAQQTVEECQPARCTAYFTFFTTLDSFVLNGLLLTPFCP